MPAFDHLSNAEIAAVLSFVRDTWAARTPGLPAESITPESVATQRERAMTPAEVHTYRAKSVR